MDFAGLTLSPRISRVLFAAIGVAFAWVLLTLVLGFGSSDARADETDDGGAVANLVTSVVTDTAKVVTGAATTVAQTVDAATTAVVPTPAAHPAPAPEPAVVPVVTPVVKAVGTTVTAATTAVRDAVEPGVVTPIVTAVGKTVSAVPVVGAIAGELGLDETLPAAATGVDRALIDITLGLAGTVDRVVPPLVGIETPVMGLQPPVVAPLGDDRQSATAASPASAIDAALARLVALPRALAASAMAVNIFTPSTVLSALGEGGQHPPLGPSVPTSAASLGPLGAGPGVWGAIALMALVAHRAWVRRAVLEDDHAPKAPTMGTDVSPD
jgi:hypothetical protein